MPQGCWHIVSTPSGYPHYKGCYISRLGGLKEVPLCGGPVFGAGKEWTMDGPESALEARGRLFWDAAQEEYEFDIHEAEVLLEACRGLDMIDRLAAAVESDGVMLTGSQGQPVLNGAVGELRQQQAAVARLLSQLNLDAAEVGQVLSAKQAQSRAAAQARWRERKKVSGGA